MRFVKLETEGREIILSWQINETTSLNEVISFSYTLFIGCFVFRFSINCIKALIGITIVVRSRVARSLCSDPDESFRYYDINDVVAAIERQKCFLKRRN